MLLALKVKFTSLQRPRPSYILNLGLKEVFFYKKKVLNFHLPVLARLTVPFSKFRVSRMTIK